MPVLVGKTNKEDTVVEGSLAVVENSALVGRPVGSIDSNGDGSTNELRSKVVAVLDVLVGFNLEISSGLLAGLLDSLVLVFTFVTDTTLDDILESIIHKTSVAGVVALGSRTVNKLLLGEALEITITTKFGKTFKTTGSRESPA